MKFLFLFFAVFTVLTQAADIAYPFYVENPTMGSAYFNIFNAIVALMKSETYKDILQLIFLLGGFFVFVMGVFKVFQGRNGKEAILDFTKYMIAATMLLIIILPNDNNLNSQLVVESKELPVYYCNESNQRSADYSAFTVRMPQTLAWGFSAINSIGIGSTELASTVFSNVSSNVEVQKAFRNSSSSGFGSEIDQLKGLLSVRLSDLNQSISYDTGAFGHIRGGSISGGYYATFLQQCVFMVKSADSSLGTLISSTLAKTGDIRRTLNDLYPDTESASGVLNKYDNVEDNSPELISTIPGSVKPEKLLITVKDSNGNAVTGECGEFYTNVIKKYLDKVLNDTSLFCLPALRKITPAGVYSLTKSDNASAPIMEEISINTALVSAYRNANSSSKIATDISFASGKSGAEFVLNSVGTGAYMAKMLPYMQMGIRAVLYAFFPFVFLVMLLPGGFAVIKSYLQSMLWVELWSPVAAILNMFLSYFTIDSTAATYQSQGVNMLSQATIISDANMLASVGGYLYASVPALTWLILKGSAQMLGSITGGMASGFSKNLNSESIRRDLGKAKQAQLTEAKTGGAVKGMAQMDFKQAMGHAEAESTKDAAYYNSGYGYMKSHELEAKGKDVRGMYDNLGKGLHTDNSTGRKLISSGEFSAMSENRRAEYMAGLTDSELSTLASSASSSDLSKTISNFKVARYVAEKSGVDVNSAEGVKKVSDIMSNMSSGKEIGDMTKTTEYTRAYAIRHGLGYKDKGGKEHKINGSSTLGEISQSLQGVNIDKAATEGADLFMKENYLQTLLHEKGMTSDAIHNKQDMIRALKWDNKNAEDFTIKEVNGAMVAVNKKTGNTFYAQKGQFLRHSDHKFNEKTMDSFGEKYGDLGTTVVSDKAVKNGSYYSRQLAKLEVTKNKADIKAMETVGQNNLEAALTNENIARAGANGILPEAAKNGIGRVLSSMTNGKTGKELEAVKNSKSYKVLSSIKEGMDSKNELTRGRSFLAYSEFQQQQAKSSELWSSMSTKAQQESLAAAGISVDESGRLQSMSLKTQKVDLDQKDKFLREHNVKSIDKNGVEHNSTKDYKDLVQKKYNENGGDMNAAKMDATNEMFAKMRSFTEANKVTIDSATSKELLNNHNINEIAGASIQQASKNVQYASVIKNLAESATGRKLSDSNVGKFLGVTQVISEAARLQMSATQFGTFSRGIFNGIKNLKGGKKGVEELMEELTKELKKIKTGTKIPTKTPIKPRTRGGNNLSPISENEVQPLSNFSQ